MPATGTWRYVVNSFRFAIRRTMRIAFRAFFVVQGRAEGGVSTSIYPERRSRFTEWPVVCEESRRSPDLCAQRSDAFVPSHRFSRYVRAYSVHNGRRADLRGENRDRKEIGSETRKEWQWWKRKGGLRGRHVWMYEHAAIYDRRIADESHLKSTQFFKDSLTRNRSGPCASSPPLAPHRGFAVVCACFATLLSCATFSKRYVVFALFADLCERRTLPILDVFQRAYELRRLLMRAAT